MMRLIPVLLVTMLLFPGCLVKRWVAPLFKPESVEFPKVDPPTTGIQPPNPPATTAPVSFQDAKIYPDVHALERDVLARFKDKDDVERLAEVALVGTIYLKLDCSFIYNLDQQQLLALPRGFAPGGAVAVVKPPVDHTLPPATTALAPDVWAGIELMLRKGAPESAVALDLFLTKFPNDEHADLARLRLVTAHLQAGDLTKAKAALAKSNLADKSAEALMVQGLLLQMEKAAAEGKTVKGAKFFLPGPAEETKPDTGGKPPATGENQADPAAKDAPTPSSTNENGKCDDEKKTAPAKPAAASGHDQPLPPAPLEPAATPPSTAKAKPGFPAELMMVHAKQQHPMFFKTGVFFEPVFRDPFVEKYMRPGQPGFMLPGKFDLNQSTIMRPNLVLVGGYRLSSLPDPNATGKILNHCRLMSLHVIDLATRKPVFTRDLKAPK